MTYKRKEAAAGPLLTVERARRRNATMRLEMERLNAEHKFLEPRLEAVRAEVSKARKLLTRKVRELEAARIQIDQLATVKVAPLPDPTYGGPEGLLAATEEMEAHEFKLDRLGRRRRITGPSHGTREKYYSPCRCDECINWRRRKSDRDNASQQKRRAKQKQAA